MATKAKTGLEAHPYIRRFAAFIIDWYVSSFAAMIPVIVAQSILAKDLVIENRIDLLPTVPAAVCALLAVAVFMVYYCVLPLRNENVQTLGRRLLRLRLEKTKGGAVIFSDLLLRDFVGVFILQGNTTSIYIYVASVISDLVNTAAFVPYLQSAYYLVLAASTVLLFIKDHRNLQDRMSGTRITGPI